MSSLGPSGKPPIPPRPTVRAQAPSQSVPTQPAQVTPAADTVVASAAASPSSDRSAPPSLKAPRTQSYTTLLKQAAGYMRMGPFAKLHEGIGGAKAMTSCHEFNCSCPPAVRSQLREMLYDQAKTFYVAAEWTGTRQPFVMTDIGSGPLLDLANNVSRVFKEGYPLVINAIDPIISPEQLKTTWKFSKTQQPDIPKDMHPVVLEFVEFLRDVAKTTSTDITLNFYKYSSTYIDEVQNKAEPSPTVVTMLDYTNHAFTVGRHESSANMIAGYDDAGRFTVWLPPDGKPGHVQIKRDPLDKRTQGSVSVETLLRTNFAGYSTESKTPEQWLQLLRDNFSGYVSGFDHMMTRYNQLLSVTDGSTVGFHAKNEVLQGPIDKVGESQNATQFVQFRSPGVEKGPAPRADVGPPQATNAPSA